MSRCKKGMRWYCYPVTINLTVPTEWMLDRLTYREHHTRAGVVRKLIKEAYENGKTEEDETEERSQGFY